MTFSERKALEDQRKASLTPREREQWIQFGQLLECLQNNGIFVYRDESNNLELRDGNGNRLFLNILSDEVFDQLSHTPLRFIEAAMRGECITLSHECIGLLIFCLPSEDIVPAASFNLRLLGKNLPDPFMEHVE